MQVYETQTELTEAREELELLKLKLEVADQEAQAAKRQAAEATAATAALLQAHDSPGLLSPVNRRSLSREVMSPYSFVTDSHGPSPSHSYEKGCSPSPVSIYRRALPKPILHL